MSLPFTNMDFKSRILNRVQTNKVFLWVTILYSDSCHGRSTGISLIISSVFFRKVTWTRALEAVCSGSCLLFGAAVHPLGRGAVGCRRPCMRPLHTLPTDLLTSSSLKAWSLYSLTGSIFKIFLGRRCQDPEEKVSQKKVSQMFWDLKLHFTAHQWMKLEQPCPHSLGTKMLPIWAVVSYWKCTTTPSHHPQIRSLTDLQICRLPAGTSSWARKPVQLGAHGAAGWPSTPGFRSWAGLQALAQVIGKIHLGLREDLVDDGLRQPSLESKLEEFGHLVIDVPP